jgi:hypothetical protein
MSKKKEPFKQNVDVEAKKDAKMETKKKQETEAKKKEEKDTKKKESKKKEETKKKKEDKSNENASGTSAADLKQLKIKESAGTLKALTTGAKMVCNSRGMMLPHLDGDEPADFVVNQENWHADAVAGLCSANVTLCDLHDLTLHHPCFVTWMGSRDILEQFPCVDHAERPENWIEYVYMFLFVERFFFCVCL